MSPTVGIPSSRLEESKAELLARAAEAGDRGHGGDAQSESEYLQRYFQHVAPEDIVGRDPVDILGAALAHRELAEVRPQGRANVRVYTPSVDDNGWASGHTVVEIVTDDMPFLVDSVTSDLGRAGRHPPGDPPAARPSAATSPADLLEVLPRRRPPRRTPSSSRGSTSRSTGTPTPPQLDAVADGLRRVLSDVREAVEDWAKMRDAALRVAEDIAAAPPPLPDAEVSEAWELMRWLADDKFTFLGYREYDLVADPDERRRTLDTLVARPGTGLGILRSDQRISGSFGSLPPEVRSKAREPRMLVLTKANSRSTVHRPVYLDYVGVKTFDADGQVTGEKRFLGLFTSSAYSESVAAHPGAAAQGRRGAGDVRLRRGQPLRQGPPADPRDVPARRAVPDLGARAARDRRPLSCTCRSAARPGCSCARTTTAGSCPAWCTCRATATPPTSAWRWSASCARRYHGETVDYTARVSESVLARLHFVVRVHKGEVVRDVDHDELEAQARRGHPVLGRRLRGGARRPVRRGVRRRPAAGLRRRVPRGVQGGLPGAHRRDGHPPARGAASPARRCSTCTPRWAPRTARSGSRSTRPGQPLSLSRVLPVLQRMGVEVVDERPYEIERPGHEPAWVYDFGLRVEGLSEGGDVKVRFQDAFAATWSGGAESDGFNALVVRAGLTWRQAMVLRAYAKYLRQAGSTFSQEYLEQSLATYVPVTRLLVRLFEARLDPDLPGGDAERDEVVAALVEEVTGALDASRAWTTTGSCAPTSR